MVFIRNLPQERSRAAVRKGGALSLVHPTCALRSMLRRLRRLERPYVLDLGSAEGPNLEFFTLQGCRVAVENLMEVLPLDQQFRPSPRVRRPGAPRLSVPLLAERRPPEEQFDAVLCWDLLDLLNVERAAGLVQEIRSRLRPRGMVWALFESSSHPAMSCLRRFRILGEQSIEHRLRLDRPVARCVHQNRDILAMFDGFEVMHSTFLRVGMREMLFVRAAASAA